LRAQIFCVVICVLGLGTAVYASVNPGPLVQGTLAEYALFVLFAATIGRKKVKLLRSGPLEEMGSMSLGSAITFLAMLRFGPAMALLVGCTSSFSACAFPRRQPVHQLLFNISLTALASWPAGLIFVRFNGGSLAVQSFEAFMAVTAATLAYFVINTGGVSTIIGFCSNDSPYRVWERTFKWTAPGYFAGASFSMLIVLLFGQETGAALFVFAPIAILIHQSFETYRSRWEEREEHILRLQANKEQLAELYQATIESLALAIDAKDRYTHHHVRRVRRYALAIAAHMGIEGVELSGLSTGALLHDIGKLGVPEYVLLKPGRLSEDEFEKIKKHPVIGADILENIKFPWPVIPVVRSHHERWDGTGYPDGLKGEDIPLLARILAVADVYDAMTSTRAYRSAWPHEMVVEGIRAESGTHFDPVVVDAFLEVIDETVEAMAAEGYGPLDPQLPVHSAAAKSRADQAALHIQRASSEIWALYEVAQTTSCSLGLQETLEILARKLQAIFPSSTCIFLLREDDSELLAVRAAVGVNREFFEGARTLAGGGASMQVLATGVTYAGPYDNDDLMLSGVQTMEWSPLRSAMIVPVTHQGVQLGTINVYHPADGVFGPQDRLLLESIAERAGMALYSGLLYERTRSDAVTDPLTSLYNLRYLTQYVEDRCARDARKLDIRDPLRPTAETDRNLYRREDSFALLCLDLDSFKPINDNFGHQKGDQVLQDLSQLFRQVVRDSDIVARYGGDEFLIVQQGAGPSEAEDLAERIQQAVENYDPGYPLHAEDCASLLSAADAHMYRHKAERKLGRLAERYPRSHEIQRELDEDLHVAALDALSGDVRSRI
jgi:putative nucleotidyltransferase with HDIG domain